MTLAAAVPDGRWRAVRACVVAGALMGFPTKPCGSLGLGLEVYCSRPTYLPRGDAGREQLQRRGQMDQLEAWAAVCSVQQLRISASTGSGAGKRLIMLTNRRPPY